MTRPGFMSGGTDPSETVETCATTGRTGWLRDSEVIGGWSTRHCPTRHGVRRHRNRHGAPREFIEDAVLGVEEDLDQAPMTSSYIWDLRQRRARHQYGVCTVHPVQANSYGCTHGNTGSEIRRQGLSAAPIVARRETNLEDSNRLAVHDISTMDIQPWNRIPVRAGARRWMHGTQPCWR